MKALKTIITALLLLQTAISFGQGQQTPNKEETISYINKILRETVGFRYDFQDGSSDKVGTIYMNSSEIYVEWAKENKDGNEYGWRTAVSNKWTSLDFSNLLSVKDCGDKDICYPKPSSTVKELHLKFDGGVLRTKRTYNEAYWGANGGDKNWRFAFRDRPTSIVWICYKDTPGTRERLIKALNHLAKLAKEEKNNDPFGN